MTLLKNNQFNFTRLLVLLSIVFLMSSTVIAVDGVCVREEKSNNELSEVNKILTDTTIVKATKKRS